LEPSLNVPYDPLHLGLLIAGTSGAVQGAILGLYNRLPDSLKLKRRSPGR